VKTISLTERTIRHVGHGVVGTFTFSVGGDGPPTTFQVAIEHPHHDAEALELAAWQRASRQAMASKPGPRQVADHPIMPQIEHVVVLMLENRGFDHVMGWLYEQDQPKVNLPSANVPANQQGLPNFIGLDPRSLAAQRLSLEALTNKLTEPSDDGEVLKTLAAVAPRRGARSPSTPNHNPGEFYQHILAHLFDYPYEQIPSFDPARITQRGYLADYYREGFAGYQLDDAVVEKVSEIMDTYLPEQLPILNGLARHYAVSDLWFCSVPSQTNTNRAFLAAGTARGMVKNGFYGKNSYYAWLNSDTLPADTRTVFDVLEETGHGDQWMYFWHSSWPPTKLGENQYTRIMFPQLAADRYDGQFAKMDEFYERAAAGTLPAVSFIEPEWGGGKTLDSLAQLNGNDYHPVSDTTKGEDFVLQVYRSLATGPAWNKTLFLITFDENGGTYDHVPPPKAQASDVDKAPQGYKNNDLDSHTRTQFGFKFDLYGVRIPTLAISPWIAPQTVFRSPTAVPYDHTSVNATILSWLGVPADRWKLGQRTAAAPTFDQVLTLGQPRPPGDATVGINFGTPPTRAPNAVGPDLRHEVQAQVPRQQVALRRAARRGPVPRPGVAVDAAGAVLPDPGRGVGRDHRQAGERDQGRRPAGPGRRPGAARHDRGQGRRLQPARRVEDPLPLLLQGRLRRGELADPPAQLPHAGRADLRRRRGDLPVGALPVPADDGGSGSAAVPHDQAGRLGVLAAGRLSGARGRRRRAGPGRGRDARGRRSAPAGRATGVAIGDRAVGPRRVLAQVALGGADAREDRGPARGRGRRGPTTPRGHRQRHPRPRTSWAGPTSARPCARGAGPSVARRRARSASAARAPAGSGPGARGPRASAPSEAS
jgi:phospholipase C